MNPKIDWNFPAPRPGWRGEIDRFLGPGITETELNLELDIAIIAGLGMWLYALTHQLAWSGWQIVIAVLLAFDLAGGVVTNATSTAKRWYHREGQSFRHHMTFIAVHGIHLALVAWLFRAGDWGWAGLWYAFLLGASALILAIPLYLRRPMALIAFVIGFLFHQYVGAPTPGLEWFIPVFLLKLLISHLLREEPYRP
jgi:hypothetical protein